MSRPVARAPSLQIPQVSGPTVTFPDNFRTDCMEVVAQGVSGAHPLSTPVAETLAADTEHFLRSLVAEALKFMAHSRSRVLTVSHISSALRLLVGQEYLGQRCPRDFHALPFTPVVPGVHVRGDRVVSLRKERCKTLPPASSRPAPHASWLRPPPRGACPSALTAATIALDPGDSSALLRALRESRDVALGAPAIFSLAATRVDAAARPGGDNSSLRRAIAVTHAVLQNPWHGAESCLDLAARILLTCLLGRSLGAGTDGAWQTRQMASEALRFALETFDSPVFRARVLKTLIAVLTDNHAPLESMYGAILGLAATGQSLCSLLLDTHLPALFRALEVAFAASEHVSHPQAVAVRERISRICEVIAVAKDTPTRTPGTVQMLQ